MVSKILFVLFSVILLIQTHQVFADEQLPVITIDLISGDVIDLDKNPQIIRANIEIQNYNPQDGYHYMEITRLSDGEIIKDTEIIPKSVGGSTSDDLYKVQILHYLDPDTNEEYVIGDYVLRIYSEFGSAEAVSTFSVIKSSMPSVVPQSTVENLVTTEESTDQMEKLNVKTVQEPESKIPSWVHDIFVWYAEETISETELLGAIEYLLSQGILNVDSN